MTRCLGCMAEYESKYGICPYCGYEQGMGAESSLHMQPGSILAGKYLIGRVIGYGGFGVTYIGWDETLRQRVAIKEYLPSEFATRAVGQTQVTVFGGNKAEQFNGGMVKFVEEARHLVQFQNEPGIVRVFDSFEANNTAYIVMEYLDGETLTSYLEREGKVPVEQAVEMLTPVIRSLEAVHKTGIIHRDIAPDNIMLTRDGQVKLIDFGAARYATTSHSRSLTVIIKPGYSPEEQYRSRGDQGPHTDVYALAAVLYRMVTGITPPDALERRAFYENKKKDILVPVSKNCKIEKNKENAILNAMNVRIEDRTKTAEAFLNELTSETPVKRLAGKIRAVDLMKWPLWAKILIPAGAAVVVVLFALLLTGRISFSNNLITDFTLGADMTRVPSVINCSVGVAQDKLNVQELTSVISGREISDTIPANMVLRQGVDAGGVVQKGTSVELYVSAAADPVVEDGTMPDVAFYSEDEARSMLTQLGAVVSTEEEYSSDVAEGVVIRTSVGYGEPLAEGDSVIIYISKGPDPAAVADSNVNNEATASLTVSRSSLNLFVGDTVTLSANGGSGSLTWSSSNSRVASVKNGTVTAVGRGSAIITVTSGDKSVSCAVTVQDYSLSLSESYLSMFVGENKTLSASGAPSGVSVSWSSSNARVATVSGGKVTAVSSGSATITASFSQAGQTYSQTCSVSVNTSGITLSQYSISELYAGNSVTLSATTSPSGQSVSWSSSNARVATVSGGKVTAVSTGSATITASFSYGGQTYSESCSVQVKDVSVSLSRSSLSLTVGDSGSLSATASPYNADIKWSSSDTNVATVDNHGRVKAIRGGFATITVEVSYGNTSSYDTCYVSVEESVSIQLSESSVSMTVGDSRSLSATKTPNDATVSWSSSDDSVVSVSSSGKVTAVGSGTATVTAKATKGNKSVSASCRIAVEDANVSISLSETSLSMATDDTKSLSAYTTPGDASVTWSSSDSSIVTVSSSGMVSAVGAGAATITATAQKGSKSATASCQVTVSQKESTLCFLGMNVPNGSISFGEVSLSGTVVSNYELTWISASIDDLNKDVNPLLTSFDMPSGKYSYSLTAKMATLMGKVTYPSTFRLRFEARDASGKEIEYTSTFTISSATTANTKIAVVVNTNGQYLAINDAPAASPGKSNQIGRIPPGGQVTVYPDKTSGNWYWVEYNGVSGYAYSGYLSLQ